MKFENIKGWSILQIPSKSRNNFPSIAIRGGGRMQHFCGNSQETIIRLNEVN